MGTEGNKREIRTFDLTFDSLDLGNILLVNATYEKELHDIMKGKTNRRIDVKEWISDFLLEVEMDEFVYENLEKILGKDATNIGAGTTSITNEEVLLGLKRVWVNLAEGSVAQGESPISAVAVTTTSGATTFTVGTDYVVDYSGARIYAESGGAIISTSVDVDYTYTTQASKRIKIGTAKVDTTGVLTLTKTMENGQTLTIHLFKAFVADAVAIPHAMDELTRWTVTFRAIEVEAQTGQELGYVDITTA